MDDLFRRTKQTASCLSALRRSLLILGEVDEPERARAMDHLGRCMECSTLLRLEREAVSLAKSEPLPSSLGPVASRSRRARRLIWWAPAFAIAASLLGFVIERPQALMTIRPKGPMPVEPISLSVSVVREGLVWVHDAPIDRVGRLRTNDRMIVRVTGGRGKIVILQGWEDGEWRTYFDGPKLAGQWLPVVVRLTSGTASRLRLLDCDKAPPSLPIEGEGSPCDLRIFEISTDDP